MLTKTLSLRLDGKSVFRLRLAQARRTLFFLLDFFFHLLIEVWVGTFSFLGRHDAQLLNLNCLLCFRKKVKLSTIMREVKMWGRSEEGAMH